MKKPIKRIIHGIISYDDVALLRGHLESTEDFVWLSKTTRCRKHTLRGVPASAVDVIIDEAVVDSTIPITIELVRKQGRHDGNIRDRICIRRRLEHQVRDLPVTSIDIDVINDTYQVSIGDIDSWYKRLRSDLNDYTLARIVMWHWRRYYLHLKDGDAIREMADQWAIEVADEATKWPLAEANRAASRHLYRYSRNGGWRKLTKRERERYAIRSQWVRDEVYHDAVAKKYGNPLGVGEYTLGISRP